MNKKPTRPSTSVELGSKATDGAAPAVGKAGGTGAVVQRPWLVAAWPGMGNVAMIAASYLVQSLDMKPIAELRTSGYFDINQVVIKDGVVAKPQLPRCVIYYWKNPAGRDLYVFMGGAQSTTGTYSFAQELLEQVAEYKIDRVITFASLSTKLHPTAKPKVAGVGTDKKMLAELKQLDVGMLQDGEIGGLNGVLLGAAAERGIAGVCLLGEIPYFAASVPNPKGALAVLEVFGSMVGVNLDLEDLQEHTKALEEALLAMMDRMKQQANGAQDEEVAFEPGDQTEEEPEPEEEKVDSRGLNFAARARIESLFQEAQNDRDRVKALKQELDRMRAFRYYENRFLDLFKKAG